MEEQEIMSLVSSTALLMEQFERRCTMIEQQLVKTRASLDTLVSQVPHAVERSADGALGALPDRVMAGVQKGLDRPVSDYERRLGSASTSASEAAQRVADQVARMERLHRHLVWKVVGAVGGSVAVLLVAAIWLSSHYMGVIRENQLSAELLKAYNAADVTLCNGQLCANVNSKARRLGNRGQYLPVNPRP